MENVPPVRFRYCVCGSVRVRRHGKQGGEVGVMLEPAQRGQLELEKRTLRRTHVDGH